MSERLTDEQLRKMASWNTKPECLSWMATELAALRAENERLAQERDEARSKRDQWQRELAAEVRLRTTHAAHAENERRRNERLREALRPFADYAAWVSDNHPGWDHDEFSIGLPGGIDAGKVTTLAPFRRARVAAALGAKP